MNGLYSKLAATGIRKNGKSYVPFILTCALMTAVFYILSFLSGNSMLIDMAGGGVMSMILQMGLFVLGIFSAIFLFYTSSVLMKRRKKEFGLYNILGLGKRQIARVLVRETLFLYLISEIAGIAAGILFSKLAEILAAKMLRGSASYAFSVDFKSIVITLVLFAAVFAVILINSLRQMFFSRPIELLHSESTGEKPPRTNIPCAVIGILLLSAAYFLASIVKDPVAALPAFVLAVILVMIATYLLFITGSVVICRILQKNKRYYYRTNHFVSISQMTFRMRKNGAGLASICILSTMVLVTISSTIAMYVGIPDMIGTNFQNDITVSVLDNESYKSNQLIQRIDQRCEDLGFPVKNAKTTHQMELSHDIAESVMGLEISSGETDQTCFVDGKIIPLDEADNNIKSLGLELGERDIAVFEPNLKLISKNKTVKFGSLTLNVIPIDSMPEYLSQKIYRTGEIYAAIYVRDTKTLGDLYKEQKSVIDELNEKLPPNDRLRSEKLYVMYGFDVAGSTSDVDKVYASLYQLAIHTEDLGVIWNADTNITLVERYYGVYGGLLFLGILLGGVFALSAALIMYYKQISEGFEDAARFEIFRKVGMTRREIKSAINSQVPKVFFLPLIAAGVHLFFAFPMLAKMLNLFEMYNVPLFAFVTLICYGAFALIYLVFYLLTSVSYKKIIG